MYCPPNTKKVWCIGQNYIPKKKTKKRETDKSSFQEEKPKRQISKKSQKRRRLVHVDFTKSTFLTGYNR